MRRELRVEIHTADRHFVCQLLPVAAKITLRWNAASTAYLTVPAGHPSVSAANADGARAVVWMVMDDGGTLIRKRLLEGPIGETSGEGAYGDVSIPVIDDFVWFSQVLGWPKPSAPLNAQTDEYARYSGSSETRALAAIAANVTRLGLPWNVPATAGRGTTGTTELRMHPLSDKILPALVADQLQLTIERDAATDRWDVSVSEGETYSRPITPQSGVLGAWKWRKVPAGATRVVVGGAGQGSDRKFDRVIDAALESSLAKIIEVFDDSRMAEAGADLTPYGRDTLAAASAKAGIEASLRESTWFQYPGAYDLGTRMTISVGSFDASDIVTEIGISLTKQDGLQVTPRLGLAVNDPQERLARFVNNLATSVRSLERR